MRIIEHPILGRLDLNGRIVNIFVDGHQIEAVEGEPIAAALAAAGIKKLRNTAIDHHPRGVFCAIGRCTDCAMAVDGVPNIRTCVTRVRRGMKIETQNGLGKWGDNK